ncbi:MAG: hypothetical protein K8H88_31905 [Sandaracinaceae bacterium]|nr:hypothetical protein [Sandaracinaceae bacterium]
MRVDHLRVRPREEVVDLLGRCRALLRKLPEDELSCHAEDQRVRPLRQARMPLEDGLDPIPPPNLYAEEPSSGVLLVDRDDGVLRRSRARARRQDQVVVDLAAREVLDLVDLRQDLRLRQVLLAELALGDAEGTGGGRVDDVDPVLGLAPLRVELQARALPFHLEHVEAHHLELLLGVGLGPSVRHPSLPD